MEHYRMVEGKDVTDFLSGFLSFIQKIINYVVTSIKEYIFTMLTIFVVILGAGAYQWYSSQLLYESEMVCEFNSLGKKTYGEMVQKLDILAKSKSYHALAHSLRMSETDAKAIVGIEGRNMEGSMLYEDPTSNRGPLYFKVIATNNKVFSHLQPALLQYLNSSSPYRTLRNEMEAERIRSRLAFLTKDITIADSLLLAYSVLLKNSNGRSFSTFGMPNLTDLLNYKRTIEDDYVIQAWRVHELQASVELLHGFLPPDNAIGKKNKTLLITAVLALVVAVSAAVVCKSLGRVPNPQLS